MSEFDRTAEYANHHSEDYGKKTRKTIWAIFWILLAVTTAEVSLGLSWDSLGINWDLVKWTFIILTLVKAYYIVAHYMHLKHEYKNFIIIISATYLILGLYFVILILNESLYLYDDVDHLLQ